MSTSTPDFPFSGFIFYINSNFFTQYVEGQEAG